MADTTKKIKVCVIGAGAAGLCALRHLAGNPKFEVIAYEQTSDIGGTWVYNELIGLDENRLPVHTSMYENLRTNLPARIMNFPDYIKMKGREPSCVSHREVLRYLKDYCAFFNLHRLIEFDTKVEHVHVESSRRDNSDKWFVQTKKVKSQETAVCCFDAIMVCNGHYFEPYVPNIPGLRSFTGLIMHSHTYRKPQNFSGKTVFILGAGSSGIDIAIELSDYAKFIYLSHNDDKLKCNLPSNIQEVVGVKSVCVHIVYLEDDTVIKPNVFIFCTGYQYSFPFLDKNCDVRVKNNFVTPLYKHLINIVHPTMCIVGIPMQVLPFPMFHMQVQYFLALLEKRTSLPSLSIMLQDSKPKTTNERHAHILANEQHNYNDSLAIAGGFNRLPTYYKAGYILWLSQKNENLLRYKNSRFVVCEDAQTVEIVLPN